MRLNLGKLEGLRDVAMDAARNFRAALSRPRASASGPSGYELLTYGSVYGGEGVGPYQALQCAPVDAVIKVISQSFAQLECHLHAKDERGGAMGRQMDHPVAEMLADIPNPEMTWLEFRQYSQAMSLLWGNAYAWIVRDYRGDPAELWALRPEQVALTFDPREPLKPLYIVTGPDGSSYELHRCDLLHIHELGTTIPYLGDSPVLKHWRVISNWIAMEAHLVRLFGRGARPSGVLQTQKVLSAEAVSQLRRQMDATHGGVGSAQTLVLEEGLEWKPMAFNSVDSEFSKLRAEQFENICRIWRVPMALVGDPSKSIGSTAETMGRFFVTYTLQPLLDAWEKAFAISLLSPEDRRRGYYLQHDISDFTTAESLTRWQANVAALTNGVMSVNEVRDREHMPPIDGGDTYRVPVNTQPATSQYHGQNSHVIDPNPTLTAPLQTPEPGRSGHALVPYQASEARMLETRHRLELALSRDPARLRLAAPPRAAARPRAEPWIEITGTPHEES